MSDNNHHPTTNDHALGFSGRIARQFQANALTPLLAFVAALLGVFALLVTPREEEPQIDVTMANVIIAMPGASAADVEQMLTIPAEQVLSQMQGLEHIYAVSEPELAIITVQFSVGVNRETALTRLYHAVHSNADWLPPDLGALPPIIKAKGIESVPILALTLTSTKADGSAHDLTPVAHLLENELKRVPGTREVSTIGAAPRVIEVRLDPARMRMANLSVADLRYALQATNRSQTAGELIQENQRIRIETGPLLDSAESVGEVIVGVHNQAPVTLSQVATVVDAPALAQHYVWHWQKTMPQEQAALTVQISKKPGENAVDVSARVLEQVNKVQGVLIPDDVNLHVTRNYGATANDKANTLMQKLIFATLSVIALVFFALGKREAMIVGVAVLLTLTATLFASWAWGFTLNRVSLFALIFSIGILVDDAIVVVENIHRHRQLSPDLSLRHIIPRAVDEVGGPTILATLTVIAALLPMAFVSGLMGPYMAPIPINASLGMMLSLAIAFTVTPWLAYRWLAASPAHTEIDASSASASSAPQTTVSRLMRRLFTTLLLQENSSKKRRWFFAGVGLLIGLSMALPVFQLVILKMLPFDNKSEFQLVVDMDDSAALEHTSTVLHALGAHLQKMPDVESYQAYAGTSAPITFNGLIRQYDGRRGGNVGDIQVNLRAKNERAEKSHVIAQRLLPEIEAIAKSYNARIKVVEVPPGPPVMSPIVAEIYGPEDEARNSVTEQVRKVFEQTPGIVGIDDSNVTVAPRWILHVDQRKAALLGVNQALIASTLRAVLQGEDVSYIQDALSKYPTPIRLRVHQEQLTELTDLLAVTVATAQGKQVALSELVSARQSVREQIRHRKDGLPVSYVFADKASTASSDNDSPLYGLFSLRPALAHIRHAPNAPSLGETFIEQPQNAWTHYSIKWDGEWQITYETFRDMGAAYAVGLLLIYILVVAEFKSYLTPLIIMAPIPLTIIGVMPGHALLGAQFTATSMIGMIALAGIIVRNSILLVDFIELQIREGVAFKEAIVRSAEARAQPILLTALAAMIGALFILDDPIFNGLAISMIYGVMVSTLLTLLVIPLLYYRAYRSRAL